MANESSMSADVCVSVQSCWIVCFDDDGNVLLPL